MENVKIVRTVAPCWGCGEKSGQPHLPNCPEVQFKIPNNHFPPPLPSPPPVPDKAPSLSSTVVVADVRCGVCGCGVGQYHAEDCFWAKQPPLGSLKTPPPKPPIANSTHEEGTMPDLLLKALKTQQERAKIYGKSHEKHGNISLALFPDGLVLRTAEDFNRFAVIDLLIVKLNRLSEAFSNGEFHHDSPHDLGVYAFMFEELSLKAEAEIIATDSQQTSRRAV